MKRSLLALAVALAAACMPSLALASTSAPAPSAATTASDAPAAPSPSPSPSPSPAAATRLTRVRVLVDCEHGKPNDVASLPPDVAKAAEKAGLVDGSKAAVDYASDLEQNQPKPKTT